MKRKIECLERLFSLLKCKVELLQFLKEERIITDDIMQTLLVQHHSMHANKIATIMAEATRDTKLQLVDYEWSILPLELVRLTIVTHNTKRVFEYSPV